MKVFGVLTSDRTITLFTTVPVVLGGCRASITSKWGDQLRSHVQSTSDLVKLSWTTKLLYKNSHIFSSGSSWLRVAPDSLRKMMNWIKKKYGANMDIYITEMGYSDHSGTLLDFSRVSYLSSYLLQLSKGGLQARTCDHGQALTINTFCSRGSGRLQRQGRLHLVSHGQLRVDSRLQVLPEAWAGSRSLHAQYSSGAISLMKPFPHEPGLVPGISFKVSKAANVFFLECKHHSKNNLMCSTPSVSK